MMPKNDIKVTKSSGNVFADLELPNAETLQLKSSLTQLIGRAIREDNLTNNQTADILNISGTEVSELLRGRRLRHYSVKQLLNFLKLLGHEITVESNPQRLNNEQRNS